MTAYFQAPGRPPRGTAYWQGAAQAAREHCCRSATWSLENCAAHCWAQDVPVPPPAPMGPWQRMKQLRYSMHVASISHAETWAQHPATRQASHA